MEQETTTGHFVGWMFGCPQERKSHNFKTPEAAQKFLQERKGQKTHPYSIFLTEEGKVELQIGYDFHHQVGDSAEKTNGHWMVLLFSATQSAAA